MFVYEETTLYFKLTTTSRSKMAANGLYADQLRTAFRREYPIVYNNHDGYQALNATVVETGVFVAPSSVYPEIASLNWRVVYDAARFTVVQCSNIGALVTGRQEDTLCLVYEKTDAIPPDALRKPSFGVKNATALVPRDNSVFFRCGTSWYLIERGTPSPLTKPLQWSPALTSHLWMAQSVGVPDEAATILTATGVPLGDFRAAGLCLYISVSTALCCAKVPGVVTLTAKNLSLSELHLHIEKSSLTQVANLVTESFLAADDRAAISQTMFNPAYTVDLASVMHTPNTIGDIVFTKVIVISFTMVHAILQWHLLNGERRSTVLFHKVAESLLNDKMVGPMISQMKLGDNVADLLPPFITAYIQSLCVFYCETQSIDGPLFAAVCKKAQEYLLVYLENVFLPPDEEPETTPQTQLNKALELAFDNISRVLQTPAPDQWPIVSQPYLGRYEFPSALAAEIERISRYVVASGEGRCLPVSGERCKQDTDLTKELPLGTNPPHPHPVATFYPVSVMTNINYLAAHGAVVKAVPALYTGGTVVPTTTQPFAWPGSASCAVALPRSGTDFLTDRVSRVTARLGSVTDLEDAFSRISPAQGSFTIPPIPGDGYATLVVNRARTIRVLPSITVYTVGTAGQIDVQFSGKCAAESNLVVILSSRSVVIYNTRDEQDIVVGTNFDGAQPALADVQTWERLMYVLFSKEFDQWTAQKITQRLREKLCGIVRSGIQVVALDNSFAEIVDQRGPPYRLKFHYRVCMMLECHSRFPGWRAKLSQSDEGRMQQLIQKCISTNVIYGLHENV